jgi:hypothetical protein
MLLKLNVGLSKDVELSDGSVEVACGIEVRLDVASLGEDLDAFERTVREAYQVCEHAIDEELKRQASLFDKQPVPSQSRFACERLN